MNMKAANAALQAEKDENKQPDKRERWKNSAHGWKPSDAMNKEECRQRQYADQREAAQSADRLT